MKVKRLLGYGMESNVYLILDEKVVMIDTGTGFEHEELMEEVKEIVSPDKIDYVIITHEHFDHCGGVKKIKEETMAEIMMHEIAAEIVESGNSIYASFFGASQEKCSVDVKFRGGEILNVGEGKLKIIYTPGHSPGSISIYEERSRTLFSGDTVFSGGYVGRTDFYGGDINALGKSILKLAELNVETLCPGHGEMVENGGEHIRMALFYLNLL